MENRKLQVLLVDDDPTILRILSRSLETAGYQVHTALDGQEALQAIQESCPDFLITDWEMPRLDGLELCQQVRHRDLPHYLYILFLTGRSGPDELIQGLEAGADDYLAKPVARGELLARLRAGQRVIELERQLSEMARTDPLTDTYTRRAFFEQFERELARARRYRLPLSCVMIDLDYFKKINDTHGHPAGDAVLKSVAQYIQQSCRASDYVCRYGGEEFCVLLTETTESAATVWAERVRIGIAALQIPANETTLQVTASLGVAECRADTATSAQVVELADQGLLVAKQSGRHRVVSYRSLNDTNSLAVSQQTTSDPFEKLTARNVMTTLVACLNDQETVGTAAEFFLRYRINSSPVVDEKGKLVGILSEKDVIGQMTASHSWGRPIHEVMKRNVVCYEEHTPVRLIYDFLCRVTLRRVIVVKDGYPTGLISRGTLLRWYTTWLAAHSDTNHSVTDSVAVDSQERRRGLICTTQWLHETAAKIHQHLEQGHEDFVPVLVDGASRMQELINDLLSESRYLLGQDCGPNNAPLNCTASSTPQQDETAVGLGAALRQLEDMANTADTPANQ